MSSDGSNYGEFDFVNDNLVMKSISSKKTFELPLQNVSQCVIPGNNKNEVEIQFQETDTGDKEDDCLVHIRLHFPSTVMDVDEPDREAGEGEDEGDDIQTQAQEFQRRVMEKGSIRSVTGNVIVEFSKEQGTFVTPRGRYAIQVLSFIH